MKVEVFVPKGANKGINGYIRSKDDEKRIAKVDYEKWHHLFSYEEEKDRWFPEQVLDQLVRQWGSWDMPDEEMDPDFTNIIAKTDLGNLLISNDLPEYYAVGSLRKLGKFVFPY